MSWKFPRRRVRSNNPTILDDTNENFFEYAHESGKLNEHNFQAGAISSITNLAAKAAYVVKQSAQAVEHGIVDGASGPGNTTGGADNDIIGTTGTWVGVADLSVSMKTSDSILWVLASVQHLNFSDFAMAISIDGYVLPETIVGGVTQDNDPNGFGPSTPNSPYAVDAIILVPSGEHTVAVVVKFDQRTNFPATVSSQDTIQNRELIVIELRR